MKLKKTVKKEKLTTSLLPTERTSGLVILSAIRMLIYGDPKIGKTNLCSGWEDALFLATEKGYEALKVYKKDITSWQLFKDTVKEIIRGKHKFRTIVIDTADLLFKLCVSHVCDELDIDHMSDEGYGKAYDMVKSEFDKELNKLFMTNYGVILVSHTQVKEIVSRAGRISKVVPTLSNQARAVIVPKVSVIGYMKFKTIKLRDGKFIEKRIISFTPSEVEEAGDRDGYLPSEMPTYKNPKKTYELFKHYYSQSKKGGDNKVDE